MIGVNKYHNAVTIYLFYHIETGRTKQGREDEAALRGHNFQVELNGFESLSGRRERKKEAEAKEASTPRPQYLSEARRRPSLCAEVPCIAFAASSGVPSSAYPRQVVNPSIDTSIRKGEKSSMNLNVECIIRRRKLTMGGNFIKLSFNLYKNLIQFKVFSDSPRGG